MKDMGRKVRDELMARCGHLIDPRATWIDFCDKLTFVIAYHYLLIAKYVQMSFILILQRLLILSITT